MVSNEKPEDLTPKILHEDTEFHNILVYQTEYMYEELQVEQELIKALTSAEVNKSVQIETVWSSTLCHLDDLPFDPNNTNECLRVYTRFR